MESDLDAFNDETFGDAEYGDWEEEHEKFVSMFDSDKHPQSPCEIPKTWEAANPADFWSAEDLDVTQSYDDGLKIEEALSKLVQEDVLEDPAIVNASKHSRNQSVLEPQPIPPTLNPNDIWAPPRFQNTDRSNHQVSRLSFESPMDAFARNFEMNMNLSNAPTVPEMPPSNYGFDTSKEFFLKYLQSVCGDSEATAPNNLAYKDDLIRAFSALYQQQQQHLQQPPQPLMGRPAMPPENLQKSLQTSGQFFAEAATAASSSRPQSVSSMFMAPQPTPPPPPPPPPPLIGTSGAPCGNFGHLQRPFPLPARSNATTPHLFAGPGGPLLQPQQVRPPKSATPMAIPVLACQNQANGGRLSVVEANLLLEALAKKIEMEQPDPYTFDATRGSWMNPHDQLMVLNCQMRSLNVGNAYVDDYYCAVKWLRRMSKAREARLAQGTPECQLQPPCTFLAAPVVASHLLSPDHRHRIALRCRFVILLRRRRRPNPPPSSPQQPVTEEAVVPRRTENTAHSTQLGRPTKSNISAPRVIAELSVVTALDEEDHAKGSNGKKFKTEADEVLSILKSTTDKAATKGLDVAVVSEGASVSALAEVGKQNNHRAVVAQRRRLAVLARVERLYATVLNIDETNVSITRIFVKNDESRHLMGHRLNLLKVLNRDLFHLKEVPSSSSVNATGDGEQTEAVSTTRHLALEIFEMPKGVRVFPMVLRFLFPEDRQFCVAEVISNFAKVSSSIKNGGGGGGGSSSIDSYAQMLYTPFRDTIYSATDFVPVCLKQLPLEAAASGEPSAQVNLLEARLDANILAMFSSRLGVSLYLCLLDACARSSKAALFCELFVYACRVLEEEQRRRWAENVLSRGVGEVGGAGGLVGDLPAPLEVFGHFARLEPLPLMPRWLATPYQTRGLFQFGAALRSLALVASPARSQPPQLSQAPLQGSTPSTMTSIRTEGAMESLLSSPPPPPPPPPPGLQPRQMSLA